MGAGLVRGRRSPGLALLPATNLPPSGLAERAGGSAARAGLGSLYDAGTQGSTRGKARSFHPGLMKAAASRLDAIPSAPPPPSRCTSALLCVSNSSRSPQCSLCVSAPLWLPLCLRVFVVRPHVRNATGRPSSPTLTSVMLASVTATTSPPMNRSASTSTFTVTLVVPIRVAVV